MKKRIITLILVFVLAITTTVTVFADTVGDVVTDVQIDETYTGDEDVTEEITEDVTEEISEEVTEETSEEVTEDVTEETSEDVTEDVTEETTETKTELVASPDGAITKIVTTVVKGVAVGVTATVKYFDQDEAVTLSGDVYFNEDMDNCPPIIVGEGGLNLIIKDGVTVTIDCRDLVNYAGIKCKDNENPLTITAGTDDDSTPKGTGKLIIYGSENCAAIGGNDTQEGRNITIESCVIYAYGGKNAAGIGGGNWHNGNNITINGGEIHAYGGENAAGIGGGHQSLGGRFENITINGGTVYAYGGANGGCGIGAGRSGETDGIYINENIPGVSTYVEAHGCEGGAGIGNSSDYGGQGQSAHNIKITGGTVKAYGGDKNGEYGGAGIGGGDNLKGYDITISGGDVYAESGGQAAAIGGGHHDDGYDITIEGGTVVAVAKGAIEGKDGAGIGGGHDGKGYRITITGGDVTATSETGGAGIGGGQNGKLEKKEYGVEITGGHVVATSKGNGAGIGGGENCGGDGKITISGTSTYVEATSEGDGAGIGGGKKGDSHNITINEGRVIAKSYGLGAGIGSGYDAKATEKIIINGGYINATGGGTQNAMAKNNGTGCAIGCGARNSDPSISDVYVSTSLDARFSYNDGGTYSQQITPNGGNWAKTGEGNVNYSLWRDVQISNGVGSAIVVGEQQNIPTYGTELTSIYDLTVTYISGTTWKIKWYKDGESVTAPADFSISSDMKKLYLDYNGYGDAGNYTFTISCDGVTSNEAAYTVNKKAASITSGSARKVYDGTPLTCETYEVRGFLEDVTVTCTGSQTDVGSSDNTFSYGAATGSAFKEENYNITEKCGKLLVVNELFVVTGENYYGIYDGKSHDFKANVIGKNGIDYTSKATIRYSVSDDGTNWTTGLSEYSIKNAGMKYVKAVASVTIGGQTQTLESDVYTMEVTKKNVTLKSGSKTKEYDGNALTYDDVSYGALAGGEFFYVEPKSIGTIIKVGSVTNTISPKSTELSVTNGSVDTTANYTFTYEEGTLTVTPKSAVITITTPSNSKTYDGNAIDVGIATSNFDDVKAAGDLLGVQLDRVDNYAVKDAGTYTNDIKYYKVTDANGEDVTNCYTFGEPVIGELVIEKRQVTLTSGSDLKVKTQDSDVAENKNVTESGDGLLTGEKLAYSGFQTVSEISYTPTANTFEYAAASGSAFNPDNYDITVETGYLMLVEEMSIIGEDQTFKYDGESHKAPVTLIDNGKGAAVKITYSTSTDNKTWSEYTETEPTVKDAGVLYVRAKAKKGVQEKDASYTVTVEKRTVIVTSDSASKAYDGTALTCNTYAVSGDGFAHGEGIESYAATGSQTDAGKSDNPFTYTLKANTKEANYNFVEKEGTLEVTACTIPVNITSGSDSWAYNGMPLTCTDYTATWDGTDVKVNPLYGTDYLVVIPTGSITDVGTAENEFTYQVLRDGKDVTDNYTFELEEGTLEVTPRSIYVTTASAEKVYDGTPLTAAGVTVSGDGFIEGEGFEALTATGTRTNAGTAENTVSYTFKAGTKETNYNVSVYTGTLKVNKRKVTVTSGSAVSTYNACPNAGLSNKNDCTIGGDGFVTGEASPKGSTVLPKPDSEPTTPVEAENMIDYGWAGNGNPANYEITECLGTLMIVNNSATAAVATDYVGTYDGQYHTGTFSTSIQNPTSIEYSTDGVTYSTTEPKFKDFGINDVDIRVTDSEGNTATCQYTVTINKRELTLTAGSAEKTYDGTALTCADHIVGGDGFANDTEETDADVKTTGTITDVQYNGSRVTAVPNTITALTDKDSFKVSNYDISYTNGTLKVTPRPVILISKSFGLTPKNTETTSEPDALESALLASAYEYAELSGSQMGEVLYTGEAQSIKEVVEVGNPAGGGLTEIENMGFVGDDGVTFSDFSEITDAGMTRNEFDYAEKGSTKLANYNIKVVYGVMKVSPRKVTLTSDSASKMYDGTPLTDDEVIISGDGFVGTEGASFDVTGTQTKVGKSANTFDYALKNNTKAANYSITTEEGILEVYDNDTLRIVSPGDQTYEYDGTAHGEAAKAYIGDTPLSADEVSYSTDGGKTFESENAAVATEIGTYNVIAKVTKTGYKDASVEYTIEVTERDGIEIVTPGDKTYDYDGKPHGEDVKVTVDGKEDKDVTIEYSTDGGNTWSETKPQLTEPGTVEVTVKASKENYKDATAKYKITVNAKTVNTGDRNSTTLWIILAAAAVLALFGACFLRRRKFF